MVLDALVLGHEEDHDGHAEGDVDVGRGGVGLQRERLGDQPDEVGGEDEDEDGEDQVVVLLALLPYLAGQVPGAEAHQRSRR